MGAIRTEARDRIQKSFPDQLILLKPFLYGFDVTYFEKKDINNTTIFTYILKPDDSIREAFGIDKEILLLFSPYDEFQARAIQPINTILGQFPFKNRVDSLNCIVISKDLNVKNYGGTTTLGEDCTQVIIPFVYDDIIKNANDSWYVRNVLRDNFFDVDLFGYTLPLRDETFFFGRQAVIARYIDAIKRCENRGVFGLRKTGKTSLLFKLDRVVRQQRIGFVFFYDCKSPSYRKMSWNTFLGSICENIAKRLSIHISRQFDEINIIKSFRYVMKEASIRGIKIILMFDEIEYISFKSPLDKHWENDYISFWQTLWSIQSLHRNLVFIISGVNPSVTEIDTINGIQNPLFGIVQSEYLKGLSEEDTKTMIRTLGKRMGIKFSHESTSFIYKQYCGHPMLTRLACSYINREYEKSRRPVTIDIEEMKSIQSDIDTELAYYFKHVVSEIQQFYPEEYEMFELIASGQTSDFVEYSAVAEYVKHLYSYGLIAKDENNLPYVQLPVAGRYVAIQLAKKEGRTAQYRIIDEDKRAFWIEQKVKSIITEMRHLEMQISSQSLPKLFGENSFPEADKFISIREVKSKSDFENFINTCYRCFIESIENHGKSIGKNKYFWVEIKSNYSLLFSVLERVKTYRHSQDHLRLNPPEAAKYHAFWNEDTEGFSLEKEQYFCIQQKIIDMLLSNIQGELNRFT